MDKHQSLAAGLEELEQLAFQRAKTLKGIYGTVHEIAHEQDIPWTHHLLKLFVLPFTFWGGDFEHLAEHMCEMLANKQEPTKQMKNILSNYTELPSDELVKMIIEDEKEVQDGNYDQYLKKEALAKYDAANELMLSDPKVHEAVADFFLRNPEFGAKKKVIRRRKCMERNFRQPGWEYNRKDPKSLALMEFDSLCFRFMLYGVQRVENGYKPLLQKLSVNATPFGLMIFIPRYWSFDYQRDIKWGELNRVLKAWGIKRQGAKWGATRLANRKQSKIAALAYADATERGMTGQERYDFVKLKAGLHPDMDAGSLHRVVRNGQELLEKTNTSKKK